MNILIYLPRLHRFKRFVLFIYFMGLTECVEILFSLFGGFACFRLCLKHCSKDLHIFFSHKFYKYHEYLSLCDSFISQIIWMLFGGILLLGWGFVCGEADGSLGRSRLLEGMVAL